MPSNFRNPGGEPINSAVLRFDVTGGEMNEIARLFPQDNFNRLNQVFFGKSGMFLQLFRLAAIAAGEPGEPESAGSFGVNRNQPAMNC